MKKSWLMLIVGCLLGSAFLLGSCGGNSGQPSNLGYYTRSVIGRVFSSTDSPVANATVYLKDSATGVIRTYISEEDGSYRFLALDSSHDYTVWAELQGDKSSVKDISALDNRKEVNITLRLL